MRNDHVGFITRGLIDLEVVEAFGVNVKLNDNPIGKFGTGLKYAIAVILRLGGAVTIYRGGEAYPLTVVQHEVRGKVFDFIALAGKRLSYTTDLGSGWEPWMAYRELYSNTKDEEGLVAQGTWDSVMDQRRTDVDDKSIYGDTLIMVRCEEITRAHEHHGDYFLTSERAARTTFCDIHAGGSRSVFYRGIRVGEPQYPTVNTYNITQPIELTEDRTIKSEYEANYNIIHAITSCHNEALIKAALLAPPETFEHAINYGVTGHAPSAVFLDLVGALLKTSDRGLINKSAVAVYAKHRGAENANHKFLELDAEQAQLLTRAYQCLNALGYREATQLPIRIVETLGPGVYGQAANGAIWISLKAFQAGSRILTGTLLEEYLHITFSFQDSTRDFQSYLIDSLAKAGERLAREPINAPDSIPF